MEVVHATASHCAALGIWQSFYRSTDTNQEDESHWSEIGLVARDRYPLGSITMDAAAIETNAGELVQWGAAGALVPTPPAETVNVGQTV